MRGATAYLHLLSPIFVNISIHAPHARSDTHGIGLSIQRMHISIHAPHARSDIMGGALFIMAFISIHAPHARSDGTIHRYVPGHLTYFNPRSSCEERRQLHQAFYLVFRFQSTLLMRGATNADLGLRQFTGISIHAPHARSDLRAYRARHAPHISIHAPHARSDPTE